MIPWEEIGRAKVPGRDNELILRKRGREFSIRTCGTELMNSRIYGSEEALAELVVKEAGPKEKMNILVGGLGMGYTLSRTLAVSSPSARILVAELLPEVIEWNRNIFGHLAGMPLTDPRVEVRAGDVTEIIHRQERKWEVILLDIDNGPAGLTRDTNNRLYAEPGLRTILSTMAPGGVLGIWSAQDDAAFTRRLNKCGFRARVTPVRATASGKGSRHFIWTAVKPNN